MKIVPGGLDDQRVQALLAHHVQTARAKTAPGSAHALDLEGLKSVDVTFWSVWVGDSLVGVGALKRLSATHGEIKSMHTVQAHRRTGVATTLLRHIIDAAHGMGLRRLCLETGSWAYFNPARALYRKHGFVECAPFGGYVEDLNSIFMTLELDGASLTATLAPAFHLRDAQKADVPALARLHVQTFNETHRAGRPGGPSYELRERQWRDAFGVADGSWFCCVVEDDRGELVGFAKGTPHDGGVPGYAGELNKIYLLRRVQRHGLGRMLLCAVARRFIERGLTSMLHFGDADNPSNGFYEAFGAERLHDDRGEFHGGYGWRDLHALVARCGGR